MKKSTFYLLAIFVGLAIAFSLYVGGQLDGMFEKKMLVKALWSFAEKKGSSAL